VVDAIQATETSTGTIAGGERQGVTFEGTATGTLPGRVQIVVSYSPASPVCGGANTITGGTFTLQAGGGELVGRLSGSVAFDQFCAFGRVTGSLTITGGSGQYRAAQGSGTFVGTLNHLPLLFGQPATLTGTARFTLTTGASSGPAAGR
jgi:hypothetical protein